MRNGISLKVFTATFVDQSGPAVRFPTDQEFLSAIEKNPVYEWILKKERLHDILWELERKSRTRFSVDTQRPPELSVEHIMPQSWTTNWPLPDGRLAPGDKTTGADGAMRAAILKRDEILHTLGNLTLVTGPANSAASKSLFSVKKVWLRQSLLALNLEVVENEAWGEAEIAARAQILWERALHIWPSLPANSIESEAR